MYAYLGRILNYDEVNIFQEQNLTTTTKFIRESMSYFREYVPTNSLLKEFIGGGTFDLH